MSTLPKSPQQQRTNPRSVGPNFTVSEEIQIYAALSPQTFLPIERPILRGPHEDLLFQGKHSRSSNLWTGRREYMHEILRLNNINYI